jgi:hypothetical protein
VVADLLLGNPRQVFDSLPKIGRDSWATEQGQRRGQVGPGGVATAGQEATLGAVGQGVEVVRFGVEAIVVGPFGAGQVASDLAADPLAEPGEWDGPRPEQGNKLEESLGFVKPTGGEALLGPPAQVIPVGDA